MVYATSTFSHLAQLLSCGPSEHEANVSTVLAERSALTKERKTLQAELAQLHAGNLVAQLDAQGELRSPCSCCRDELTIHRETHDDNEGSSRGVSQDDELRTLSHRTSKGMQCRLWPAGDADTEHVSSSRRSRTPGLPCRRNSRVPQRRERPAVPHDCGSRSARAATGRSRAAHSVLRCPASCPPCTCPASHDPQSVAHLRTR